MKIGELAKRAGCPVVTVRYYEKEGLLPEPQRSETNYRLYGEAHAERLAFIRRCRALDMTLEEIRALLDCHDHPQRSCQQADALIGEHLAHVEARITQLQQLESALKALQKRCQGEHSAAECGILNALTELPEAEWGEEGRHVPGTHARR